MRANEDTPRHSPLRASPQDVLISMVIRIVHILKVLQVYDIDLGKRNVCQNFEMSVLCDNEIGIGNDSAVNELVIVGVGTYEMPTGVCIVL